MIERITGVQTKILQGLARYKFLTTSQMIALEIAKDRGNLHKDLVRLRDTKKPLIAQKVFGTMSKIGKIENIHYLTKRGAEVLETELNFDPQNIKYPIGTSTLFQQDYFHRKSTIDCQIAIDMQCLKNGLEILFYERYFDKGGENRTTGTLQAKTRIEIENKKFLIADSAFMLQTPIQKELYCLEMYNGKDTQRTFGQLQQYVEALKLGSPSIKYSFNRGNRILCVFEFESMMKATIQRVNQDGYFTHTRKFFLFKTLEQMKENALMNWLNTNNQSVCMY